MGEINIAIVEDEKVQAEILEKYVLKWAREKNIRAIIKKFYNAESFEFSWSMDKRYDVILLDIQMEGQNGVELAKKIRKKDDILNIIFITGIADYIGVGYDVSALNYLIKPIKKEKLCECLDKCITKIPKRQNSILLDTKRGIERVIQSDIVYIEAFAHFIEINTINNKYMVKKKISAIEKELDQSIFVRCHRSYIVGAKYIKRIKGNQLELDNGDVIPVSRRRYSNTNMAFIKYFRGETNENT